MENESLKKSAMTIARLGAAAGVGVETVRYYQRRGLLPVPASAGAVRRYDAQDVRRLLFIRRAQAAGFTLEAPRRARSADLRAGSIARRPRTIACDLRVRTKGAVPDPGGVRRGAVTRWSGCWLRIARS
jgi:hypothetical protein